MINRTTEEATAQLEGRGSQNVKKNNRKKSLVCLSLLE
jgi:hypothetical protein